MNTLTMAEFFLMAAGACIGVGLLLAFAAVIVYCLGCFDD